MADNSINAIRDAESAAEAIVKSSIQKAGEIAQNTKKEIAELVANEQDKAKAEGEKLANAAREKSDAVLKAAELDIEAEADKLVIAAQKKQEDAVKILLDNLVG